MNLSGNGLKKIKSAVDNFLLLFSSFQFVRLIKLHSHDSINEILTVAASGVMKEKNSLIHSKIL
jgi:hypothetical protein